MTIEQWVANYSGPLMAVGGSVIVAIISAYAAIRARRSREPVPVTEIWKENRTAREEADNERAVNIFLERKVATMGIAFLILHHYVRRLMGAWGEPIMPRLRREDQERVDRVARDLEDVRTPPGGVEIVG